LSLSSQKIFDANEGCIIYADFMTYDASRSAETPVSHDTTEFVVSKCVRVIKLGWSSYPQIFSTKYLAQRDINNIQQPTTTTTTTTNNNNNNNNNNKKKKKKKQT